MDSILIVDDQEIVRMGIRRMIEKEFSGLTVFCAADGNEAYEMIEKHGCKIVICDIMMPNLDGFGFLELLQKKDIRPRIIILTAHENFSFAQKAIAFKVDGYLVKPASEAQLYEMIYKILESLRIDSLREQEKSIEELSYQSKTFVEFLAGENVFADVDWIYKSLGIFELQFEKFAICLIKSLRPIETMVESIESKFSKKYKFTLFPAERNLYILLINSDELNNNNFIDFLEQILEVYSKVDNHIYAGISDFIKISCYELPELYEEAMEALTKSLFIGSFLSVNKKRKQQQSDFSISHMECDTIVEYISKMEKEKLNNKLEEIFLRISIDTLDVETVKNALFSFINYISMSIKELYPKYEREFIKKKDFDKISSLNALKAIIKSEVMAYLNDIGNMNELLNPTEYIVGYIRKHIGEEISLSDLADKLNLNYFYLSGIFTKVKGTSFSDYLIAERIKLANVLLVTTSKKIADIASEVGYHDVKHFCKIYKKKTGFTPSEFREMSVKEDAF